MPWGMMPSGHRAEGRAGLAVTSTIPRRWHQRLCVSSTSHPGSIPSLGPRLLQQSPWGSRSLGWVSIGARVPSCLGTELGRELDVPLPREALLCMRASSRPVLGAELPQEVPQRRAG